MSTPPSRYTSSRYPDKKVGVSGHWHIKSISPVGEGVEWIGWWGLGLDSVDHFLFGEPKRAAGWAADSVTDKTNGQQLSDKQWVFFACE